MNVVTGHARRKWDNVERQFQQSREWDVNKVRVFPDNLSLSLLVTSRVFVGLLRILLFLLPLGVVENAAIGLDEVLLLPEVDL